MIRVYTKPHCPQCNATKRHLDKAGAVYETVDISLPENADTLTAVKALGYQTAPVVLVSMSTGDVHWYGYNPDLLDLHIADQQQEAA